MNLQEAILEAYKDGLVDEDFVCEKLRIMSDCPDNSDSKLCKLIEALTDEFAKGKLPKDTVKVFIKIDGLKSDKPTVTTKLTHSDKKMELSIDPWFKEKDILKIYNNKVGTITGADAIQASFVFKNYPDPDGISCTFGPYVNE